MSVGVKVTLTLVVPAFGAIVGVVNAKLPVTEALLDGDFPGHYFRRLKTVSLSIAGAIGAHSNVNCTLTLLENRIRTNANASGSYPQAEEGDDGRFLVNFAPVQAVATSRPRPRSGAGGGCRPRGRAGAGSGRPPGGAAFPS